MPLDGWSNGANWFDLVLWQCRSTFASFLHCERRSGFYASGTTDIVLLSLLERRDKDLICTRQMLVKQGKSFFFKAQPTALGQGHGEMFAVWAMSQTGGSVKTRSLSDRHFLGSIILHLQWLWRYLVHCRWTSVKEWISTSSALPFEACYVSSNKTCRIHVSWKVSENPGSGWQQNSFLLIFTRQMPVGLSVASRHF